MVKLNQFHASARIGDDFVTVETAKGRDETEMKMHDLVPQETVAAVFRMSNKEPVCVQTPLDDGFEPVFVDVETDDARSDQRVDFLYLCVREP
jgi:hypothetical protein